MKIFLVVLMMVATLFAKESITKDEVSLSYWEAKKGDSTLYLFGTMHAKDRRVKSAFEQIKPLINRVDGVYTELALTPLASMIAFKKSIRDDNKTLKEILPPAIYKELDSYLKSIHPLLSPKNFDRLKIWVVTTSLEMIKDELYYKDIEPLDKMIFNYGFRLKKEVGGIETLQEQIDIFDTLPLSKQIENLEKTLHYLKKFPNLSVELKEYYFRGENQKLLSLFNRVNKEYNEPELLNRILYERNIKMADRIDKIVSKNPNKAYLFAFGIMHFLGQKSVIELLQSKGYNVVNKKFTIGYQKDEKRD